MTSSTNGCASGKIVFTNCSFFTDETQITICNGLKSYIRDGNQFPEASAYYGSNSTCSGKFYWNIPSCMPSQGDLALWLDPASIQTYKNYKIGVWNDNTSIPQNMIQSNTDRKPIFEYGNNSNGIKGFPAAKFEAKPTSSFIFYDGMTTDYHSELSGSSTNNYPIAEPKTLYVIFKPNNLSLVRQTLFEIGGVNSGMNIYINNGIPVFGMWNRYVRKYTYPLMNQSNSPFSLQSNKVYLAGIEYNAQTQKMRATIYGEGGVKAASDWISFSGLAKDVDKSAVGCAARTRYHDYNIGATYSEYFDGYIGDVILYNKILTTSEAQSVFDILNNRYGSFAGPSFTPFAKSNDIAGDWRYIEEEDQNNESISHIGSVSPNPCSNQTIVEVNVTKEEMIEASIYDMLGNKVLNLYNATMPAGLNIINADVSSLNQGAYMLMLYGETTQMSMMLNIVK